MVDIKISAGADPGPVVATDRVPMARSASATAYAATIAEIAAYANGAYVPTYASSPPAMDGMAAPGTASTVSRGDHKHPTDTSVLPLTGGTLTGVLNVVGGTVSAPGIAFVSTGVGFYSDAGNLRVAAAGIDVFDFNTVNVLSHVPLNMSTQRIVNMGAPSSAADAATKSYVDGLAAGGVPDAPSDGTAYGRLNAAWSGVLPLNGGTVSGSVVINETTTASALTLNNATGGLALSITDTSGTDAVAITNTIGGNGITLTNSGAGAAISIHNSGAGLALDVIDTGAGDALHISAGTKNNAILVTKGIVTLAVDPVAALDAATKQYVDGKVAGGTAGVSSWNTRTGAVVLTSGDVTTALTFTPYNATNPSGYQTAANVTTALVPYAPLASPMFSGDPRSITPPVGDNDFSIATTAFVQTATGTALNNVGRNLLHNPLFNIAQRGAGPFTASGGLTVDRWGLNFVNGTASISRVPLADADRTQIGDGAATYDLGSTVAGGAAAGDFALIEQRMEDIRRLAGKTVTVSFWAAANAGTPKLGVNFVQVFGSGGSPSAATYATAQAVTLSTTWTRYSVTIAIPSAAGKTFGSNAGTDYTSLYLWQSSGATNNINAGSIGVQSYTLALWGVQLEVGGVATPLEKPDPQQDLAKCQRFYQVGVVNTGGSAGSAGAGSGSMLPFPVPMRATPTLTPTFSTQTNCASSAVNPGGGFGYQPYTVPGAGPWLLVGTFTASADL